MQIRARFVPLFLAVLFLSAAAVHAGDGVQPTWTKKGGHWVATLTYETDLGPGSKLVVKRFNGDMSFTGSEKGNAVVTITFFSRERDREEAEQDFEASRPDVDLGSGEMTVVGVKRTLWRWSKEQNYELNAALPARFNIDAGTTGGEVLVEGISGEVSLATSGGDMIARTMKGEISLATSGGELKLEDLEGEISAATSGGDINCDGGKGNFSLVTSGGGVHLSGLEGDISAATSGGDIDANDLTGGSIELSTSGGELDISLVKVTESGEFTTSGGDVLLSRTEGTITASTSGGMIRTKGHSGDLTLTTSAGDIRVRDHTGSLEAGTGAGNIEASILASSGNNGKIDLSTGIGDITIQLPADFSAYLEAMVRNGFDDGAIESDFPLNIKKSKSGTVRASGEVNGGGVPVQLETGMGEIAIRKR